MLLMTEVDIELLLIVNFIIVYNFVNNPIHIIFVTLQSTILPFSHQHHQHQH